MTSITQRLRETTRILSRRTLFGLLCLSALGIYALAHHPLAYVYEHNRFLNGIGILVILGIAYAFSYNRSAINKKLICTALLMHVTSAFLVLKTTIGSTVISSLARGVEQLYSAADAGTQFLFGNLASPAGPWAFVFAIKVLPIIIFFGALMGLLFHLGIIQKIVTLVNRLIQPLLGTSGPETLCAIANSFLGQTEAPLLIRHYLKNMTRSELLVVMVSGMGTMSGSILAVYAAMGVPVVHLLGASVMAIPATILIAKILCPETEKSQASSSGATSSMVKLESPTGNILDAIAAGTSDGLQLALNVGAMLIAFIALIALLNASFSYICSAFNTLLGLMHSSWIIPVFTLQDIFGWIFMPFGWLLGLTGTDMTQAGQLIGTKVAVNEMVAYSSMVKMGLSERAQVLLTYALCGFANFSCIGIQIGGIGALVPEKRKLLSEFGLYAVLGGTLANLLSAMVAGLIL